VRLQWLLVTLKHLLKRRSALVPKSSASPVDTALPIEGFSLVIHTAAVISFSLPYIHS
jgi:hypothetical protein